MYLCIIIVITTTIIDLINVYLDGKFEIKLLLLIITF